MGTERKPKILTSNIMNFHTSSNGSWIFIGFSFGAWIGFQTLMRRPEVDGLILIAPPVNLYDFNFLSPCPIKTLIIRAEQDEIVKKDSLKDLHKTHKLFKNIVDDKDVSVLVRCKNGTTFGKEFNDYIKDNRLNNSLAKSTKIVYITSKKIPKPLLTSEWEPEAVLIGDSTRSYTKVDKYIGTIDLQLQINGQDSYWNQIHVGADTI